MRHSIRSQIFTGSLHNLLAIGTEGDNGQPADEVLRIHDEKLAKLGTDSVTRCAIDSYRKQCFGTGDPVAPGQSAPATPTATPAPQKAAWVPKITKDSLPKRPAPRAGEETAPHPEASAPAAPPASGEEVCAACGAPVTKSRAKLSQLFMSKTICKKCMEVP